ncbi:MAG TPA: SDR family oxidoreductase [Thermomicrobiales bacterium]|nr:SDR family oxidoreductase [Thermomicrobiales bacterium]
MTDQHGASLNGKVAIVTGASSGLGRATAMALAQHGAHVALIARSGAGLQDIAQEIASGSGSRALPLPLDLADETALVGAVARTVADLGRVDILINAAGTDKPGPAETLTTEDWDQVLAVNLRAPFILAREVFPHMRQAGGGTIVNVSSVAGKRGWANASAYCASKFGLTGLTQSLAAEGKLHGIRASILYPGGMATGWGKWSAAERDDALEEPPPPTKALPPDEVAALIVWMVTAPAELVLNEAVVSPLEEEGWP